MPLVERSTELPVDVETAWQFHRDPTGLPAVMPDWLGVELQRVDDAIGGPDGGQLLDEGASVTTTVRPLGLGPERPWVSEVVACELTADGAVLRDRQTEGPFDRWDHVHRFEPVRTGPGEESCIMTDSVEFSLPGGKLGELGEPFCSVGLSATFAIRHRRTRRLLAEADVPTRSPGTLM